jgi:hypothetical protein
MNQISTNNDSTLKAYYSMEQGVGTPLIDQTGNNDAQIYGAEYITK